LAEHVKLGSAHVVFVLPKTAGTIARIRPIPDGLRLSTTLPLIFTVVYFLSTYMLELSLRSGP